jgi:hypothetical protein
MLKAEQYFQLDAVNVLEKATSLYERMELVEFLLDSAKLASTGSIPFAFEAKGDWKSRSQTLDRKGENSLIVPRYV